MKFDCCRVVVGPYTRRRLNKHNKQRPPGNTDQLINIRRCYTTGWNLKIPINVAGVYDTIADKFGVGVWHLLRYLERGRCISVHRDVATSALTTSMDSSTHWLLCKNRQSFLFLQKNKYVVIIIIQKLGAGWTRLRTDF